MILLFNIIAFFLIIFGVFYLIDLSIVDYVKKVLNIRVHRSRSLAQLVKESNREKKDSKMKIFLEDKKNMLEFKNKLEHLDIYITISILLFIVGIISAFYSDNIFLAMPLGIGFALIPWWVLNIQFYNYTKVLNIELEKTVSIITASYKIEKNIITVIEINLDNISPFLRKYFKSFIDETRLVNSDNVKALYNLKSKVNNHIFKEWVDILISCQDDLSIIVTLDNTVKKFNDTNIITQELANELESILKNHIITVIIAVVPTVFALVYFEKVNDILLNTTIGKMLIGLFVTVIVLGITKVIQLVQPIKYKI